MEGSRRHRRDRELTVKTHERVAAIKILHVKSRVSTERAKTFGTSNPKDFLATSVILDVEGNQVSIPDSISDRVRKKRILSAMGLNGNSARSKAVKDELDALYGRIRTAVDQSVTEYRFDKDKVAKRVHDANERVRRAAETRRYNDAVEAIRHAFDVHGRLLTTEVVHKLWSESVTKGVMES